MCMYTSNKNIFINKGGKMIFGVSKNNEARKDLLKKY